MHQNIKEHMEVIGSDGAKIGIVDHVQGREIKLTKGDDKSGQHHFIPLDWVDHVDQHVHLKKAARTPRRSGAPPARSDSGREDEEARPVRPGFLPSDTVVPC